MIVRKPNPPRLFLSTPPPLDFSHWSHADCDADDEDTMSAEEYPPSRPLSFSQSSAFSPTGPYCPRIPTLQEILSNTSSHPWTLSAFTAYLSQNHCLETLEFTTDADRYRAAYEKMADRRAGMPMSPALDECEHVRMLWRRLIDAYIVPNSPREVNLPSDVRDALLSLPNHATPPHPDELLVAVKRIYELMDESVLMPFINDVSPSRVSASFTDAWNESDENLSHRESSEGSSNRSRSRRKNSPPEIITSPDAMHDIAFAPFTSGHSNRHSGFSLNRGRLTHGSNGSTGSGDAMLTDDSGSPSSPSSKEPMTPPTTPPSGDMGSSPRSRNDNTWKKMMNRLGSKKKSASRMGRIEDEPMSG